MCASVWGQGKTFEEKECGYKEERGQKKDERVNEMNGKSPNSWLINWDKN